MSSAHATPAGEQDRLVAALADPAVHRDGAARATVLETHISYVLLTGRHAYKIKKAVALGFLDFTTLAARRRYCGDELRLNRRLAPRLYLDVVPITGTIDAPRFGGDGAAIEYAVKMLEFPQDALLSRALARGDVDDADIDALASIVAAFHDRVAVAPADGSFGLPERILHYALQNFAQLAALPAADSEHARLDALETWTRREYAAREHAFAARRRGGFVRECHGDLHLANIARVDGELVVFDCLEFNAELRWIDTMSEIAFVAMDLDDRGRPDLARRLRNAYLECTGDYEGLAVHRFYYVYRALVRAKVAALREGQVGAGRPPLALSLSKDELDRETSASVLRQAQHERNAGRVHDALDTELRGYVELAARGAAPSRPAIVVMHGLAGSGKSTLAHALAEVFDAIRLRTDVERKRMHGLDAQARSRSSAGGGLYAEATTRAVYDRIAGLARAIADAGYIALVDGAFLARWQRDRLRALAGELGVPFVILSLSAPEPTLRERVSQRSRRGGDASEADVVILEHQQRMREPLGADERSHTIECDATAAWDRARVEALARDIARRAFA